MRACALFFAVALSSLTVAQVDKPYGDKIREYTTDPRFSTPLVDHLPAAKGIPRPDEFFGHIIGAPNVLDYASDIAKYLRALEKASPRIKVVSMGKSEEGREMVVAFISDAQNLRRLPEIVKANARLADPRTIKSQAEADALIKTTLPMYWATGGMHAPETGPPEMLTELAYRLAASEEPYIQEIRKNEIVMITPVLDTDGRERVVDLYRYRKAHPDKPEIPLEYWGHYVAHDDNRDALTMRLALSQALMRTWLEYHPTVLHDIHESVPFLYISTGTGPYNAWLDPITISEWQEMAYNEIQQLTGLGVPGVWTHGYYDGWAASYGFYVANGHNAIGRFYEIYSIEGADTGVRSVGGASNRDWFRPNPPFAKVRWSIRNNVNMAQSALLMGLHHVAVEKDKFLHNLYLKTQRSVAKATTEGPVAYVLPPQTGKASQVADLMSVFERQGVEISRLSAPVVTKEGSFPAGSVVIRMDQPYSRMADMMLDQQYYKPSDPNSYDDTGWQLGALYDLPFVRSNDASLLKASMERVPASSFSGRSWTDTGSARVAIVHTWTDTQDDGWARLAFDLAGVPYKYVSVHELRDTADLRSKYDVILLPQTGGSAQDIVKGIQDTGGPLPWKSTDELPNLGGPDSSNDVRGGIELEGLANVQRFVKDGGLFLCIGNSCRVPITYGLVSEVSAANGGGLRAPGGAYRVESVEKKNPLLAGYGDALGVYFNAYSCPVLSVATRQRPGRSETGPRASGRGSLTDPDVIQGRPPYVAKEQPGDTPESDPYKFALPAPKVLLRFGSGDKLLISGMLEHGEELAGKAALVDCPLGKGHVLLFSFNPFWRGETLGSYNLVFNAIAHWNRLEGAP